ncbi:MAG TPA: tetratricopeptide repeat protein, partial [Gemmataceae bacterium]|nr:tetratricopeptide repeat protein [Gemmataceae bacterium]
MTPTDELFAQAVSLHQSGDLVAAESGYRAVLEVDDKHAGALSNLGVLAGKKGDTDEAVRLYTAALAANPRQLDAHFNLGNLYRRMGRPQDAVTAFQNVLRVDPQHPRAYLNLGLVAGEVGDMQASIDCFRRAVALDPSYPDAYNLLGDALFRVGRVAEAVVVFREFVARCPDDARGYHNLGLALAAQNDTDAAVAELEHALRLRPDYPDAHNSLGVTLEAANRADDAQHHYREAVRLRPDFADALSNLGTSLTEQGRVTEAAECLRRAAELRPDPRTGSNLLLTLAYSSALSPEQLRGEHEAWAAKYAADFDPAPVPLTPPPKRLKIGYVSGDFRAHTAAGLIELLLTHHDRNAVHVTCYANVPRKDEVTDRLKRLADAWKPIHTMTDAQLANAVFGDEIDVLIDLSGHTAWNRLLCFARKPAAVQFTLFGYPCTTGLKTIDYRVSDSFADPPGETDNFYV